jgi:hypothetical protein
VPPPEHEEAQWTLCVARVGIPKEIGLEG